MRFILEIISRDNLLKYVRATTQSLLDTAVTMAFGISIFS